MEEEYYLEQHSWKLKLRLLGRQVRKLLAHLQPGRVKRKRAGYVRFHSEDEQRIRNKNICHAGYLRVNDQECTGLEWLEYRCWTTRAPDQERFFCIFVVFSVTSTIPPEGWQRTSTTFPPGLRSLMHLDRLFVYREPDGSEVLRSWDSEKRYRVTDGSGQQLYTAVEESSWCGRCCLGKCRGWTFHVFDLQNREVLRIQRHLRAASCCFPCCLQKVTVYADGEVMGSVTQNWNALRPSFTIRDFLDEAVLFMKGPHCLCLCGGEIDFIVKSIDKQHSVGVITRKWTGIAREFFREGNCFGVGFPVDLDARVKATLLGACFLIDFTYFEEETNLNRINKP